MHFSSMCLYSTTDEALVFQVCTLGVWPNWPAQHECLYSPDLPWYPHMWLHQSAPHLHVIFPIYALNFLLLRPFIAIQHTFYAEPRITQLSVSGALLWFNSLRFDLVSQSFSEKKALSMVVPVHWTCPSKQHLISTLLFACGSGCQLSLSDWQLAFECY